MEEFLLMLASILEEEDYEVDYEHDEAGELRTIVFEYECEDTDRVVSMIGLTDSVLIRVVGIENFGDSYDEFELVNEWNSYYLDYKFIIDEDGDLMVERWCNAGAADDRFKYGKANAIFEDAKKMCKLCEKLEEEM